MKPGVCIVHSQHVVSVAASFQFDAIRAYALIRCDRSRPLPA